VTKGKESSYIVLTVLILWRYRLLRHIMIYYMTKICPVLRIFVIERRISCSGGRWIGARSDYHADLATMAIALARLRARLSVQGSARTWRLTCVPMHDGVAHQRQLRLRRPSARVSGDLRHHDNASQRILRKFGKIWREQRAAQHHYNLYHAHVLA